MIIKNNNATGRNTQQIYNKKMSLYKLYKSNKIEDTLGLAKEVLNIKILNLRM